MDFTLNLFRSFLTTLRESGYCFKTVREYSGIRQTEHSALIVLRHDVDKKPVNSLETARIEKGLGIMGTYYFRIHADSYNEYIIREISSMGHEIGYHYEDIQLARQKTKDKRQKTPDCPDVKSESPLRFDKTARLQEKEKELATVAIESFSENLAKLREIAPIDTICMHGSPLSHIDTRILWKYYDYNNFGISAEPYFDFSLDDMLYLSDTGRKWNGSAVSIRDRSYIRDEGYYSDWVRQPLTGSAMAITEQGEALRKRLSFRNTDDIMHAAKSQELPERMFITFHPQRWSKSFPEWMTELLTQNIKNPVKLLVNRHRITEKI